MMGGGWLAGEYLVGGRSQRPLGFHGESFQQLWCGGRHFLPLCDCRQGR